MEFKGVTLFQLRSVLEFLPGTDLLTAVQSCALARDIMHEFVTDVQIGRYIPIKGGAILALLQILDLGCVSSDLQLMDLIVDWIKKYGHGEMSLINYRDSENTIIMYRGDNGLNAMAEHIEATRETMQWLELLIDDKHIARVAI